MDESYAKELTLKSIRESLVPKKSQAEVAKAIGVNQTSVARWESGDRMPTLDNAVALAKFYGVSLKYLAFASGIDVTGLPDDKPD